MLSIHNKNMEMRLVYLACLTHLVRLGVAACWMDAICSLIKDGRAMCKPSAAAPLAGCRPQAADSRQQAVAQIRQICKSRRFLLLLRDLLNLQIFKWICANLHNLFGFHSISGFFVCLACQSVFTNFQQGQAFKTILGHA